jgi:hypothetical protein
MSIIITALPDGVSTSNCTDWNRCLLELPSSRDYAYATIPRSFEEKTPFKIHVLTSMRYPLRSFVRLPLYPGAHSHPSRPFPCSTRYALQSVLNSPTMLWPYRSMWVQDLIIHAMERPLATPMYILLLQKDAGDGVAFNPHGSFGWALCTDQEELWHRTRLPDALPS